jgi:SAM-dependent methyltransferase
MNSPRCVGTLAFLGRVHDKMVYRRRVTLLSQHLAVMLEPRSRLLDIGCGDGQITARLRDSVDQLEVEGVEVLPRPDCAIENRPFDGKHVPFSDNSFNYCLLVDVLHHIKNPVPLLKEACRVSSQFVLIKDHYADHVLDHWTLRLMDWVGNKPHGVALPYAYLSRGAWDSLYHEVGLVLDRTDHDMPLYPSPFSLLFGRHLHFISLLRKAQGNSREQRTGAAFQVSVFSGRAR